MRHRMLGSAALFIGCVCVAIGQNFQTLDLDFSTAVLDPTNGKLCKMQRVCINPEEVVNKLPEMPCFPPGCSCNSAADCGGDTPFCADCNCSRFPQGCDCDRDMDCPFGFCVDCQCSRFRKGCTCDVDGDCGRGAFCVDCNCSAFPPGCDCNRDRDCGGAMPYCADCQCSAFPQGCDCSRDRDCGGATPFCADCQCSAFPQGCDCNRDRDCGGAAPFCADCKCSMFPKGCDCSRDRDCGNGFCVNCQCSKFPEGCNCNSIMDCGLNAPFCADCQCSRFPQGCDCNGDRDCGNGFCVDCQCSKFPRGCNCNGDNDCGGVTPFCNDCQCSRFRQGCNCDSANDCGGSTPFCANCKCSSFPAGCDCNDPVDCPFDRPNCNDCKCTDLPPGCNCDEDSDCDGPDGKCVACVCKDCPVSTATSSSVINPPLIFVVDTTKSVKPDKFSIFNLTQKVVDRIIEVDANIPSYTLFTFNDFGPNFRQNVDLRINTGNVIDFKQEIIGLRFESFDGGRDSKERMMQGLLAAVQSAPQKSLVVVFTDNGSKDLNLRNEIIRVKNEKLVTVYIVLTPIFEGFPNDPSLRVYAEVADQVFFINEVGADVFITTVQTFEETNCV